MACGAQHHTAQQRHHSASQTTRTDEQSACFQRAQNAHRFLCVLAWLRLTPPRLAEHGVDVQRARVHLRAQHRQDSADQVRNAFGYFN
jgi:hypothetical protein